MSGWYELKNYSNGTCRFYLYSRDGQRLLQSAVYPDSVSAEQTIEAIQNRCGTVERFKKGIHSGGKNYFVLRGAGNTELLTSHLYDSESALERAISLISSVAQTGELKKAA